MVNTLTIDDLLTILQSRRSIRSFQASTVPPHSIDLMLEAARWAPSAHNRQPWRFIVIFDKATQDRLLKGMATKYHKDLGQDGLKKDLIEQIIIDSQRSIREADVLILAGIEMTNMDQYPDAFRQQCEREMAIQSLGAAIQNLLLASHVLGIGGCWRCAPLFCPEVIRDMLKLPISFEPQALVTLGCEHDHPQAPPRHPVSKWTTFIRHLK